MDHARQSSTSMLTPGVTDTSRWRCGEVSAVAGRSTEMVTHNAGRSTISLGFMAMNRHRRGDDTLGDGGNSGVRTPI